MNTAKKLRELAKLYSGQEIINEDNTRSQVADILLDAARKIEEQVGLKKSEAYSIAEQIDHTLIQEIRNDLDIDSMGWLRNIIHGYEKLCKYGDYQGATEPFEDGEA